MVRGGFKSIDIANAVICALYFFEKINFSSQNLLGCWFSFYVLMFFVKMDVKSHPFE